MSKTNKKSAVVALAYVLLVIGIELISDIGGIYKNKVYPEPKTLPEILNDWHKFVFSGILTFLIAFYWHKSKKQLIFKICPECRNVVSVPAVDDKTNEICNKCNVVLEKLDGFYERHPGL